MAIQSETTTEFWMARFYTPDFVVPLGAQLAVNGVALENRISVVGYAQENSLTVLHWPEEREGYQVPTVEDCTLAARALCTELHGDQVTNLRLGRGKLHTVMGLRVGGYEGDDIARVDEVQRRLPKDASVGGAHMVSARYRTDRAVIEPYHEPVAIIEGVSGIRPLIHEIAHGLRQRHYVIESSDQPTALYTTSHAFRWPGH